MIILATHQTGFCSCKLVSRGVRLKEKDVRIVVAQSARTAKSSTIKM